MTPNKDNKNTHAADKRLAKTARSLSNQGMAPERDLWPDIDSAITAAEQNQIRPMASRRSPVWPRFAALAAAIGLVVLGWWGSHSDIGEANLETREVAQIKTHLEVIDDALAEVNQALAESPDDPNLTRMARKLYMSRGQALRENARTAVLGG
ncbi:MAG: hypothetical protein ACI9UK_002527 [Candidatus Krumholzibacteriia bacterium]|jgi:hypothetical protein